MSFTAARRHVRKGFSSIYRAAGFSMVELMVTIAVLAIVTAAAFPSFTALVNGNRLTGSANEMLASLQLARSEAIRRNARVMVCRSEDSATCAGAAGLWTSWITIVDGGAEPLRVSSAKAPLQLEASESISGDNDRIVFRPDGMARTDAGLLLVGSIATCLATERPADNARIVRITSGSRFGVVPESQAGACPAPDNAAP